MSKRISELSEIERNFLKDKCLDEIMVDQIFSSLFSNGYLKPETQKLFSKHIRDSKYYYSISKSLEKGHFFF